MGLSAISLLEININLSRYKEITEPLLRVKWYQLEDRTNDGDMGHVSANTTGVTSLDIYHYGNIRDGIDFFKAILVKYDQKKKEALPPNWDLLTASGYMLDPRFRWEGEDLVMENSMLDLYLVKSKMKHAQYGAPFKISFEKLVGVDFGWVSAKSEGMQTLGRNIRMEYHHLKYDKVVKYVMENGSIGIMSGGRGKIKDIIKEGVVRERTLRKLTSVPEPFDTDEVEPKTHAGTVPPTNRFWRVTNKKDGDENRVHRSGTCCWRFTIKRAFEEVVGGLSRSLFIYTDAGGSTMVGNRVTDLLLQVKFSSEVRGSQYFEPIHIQYIPVRKEVLDIIEVNVAETTGELA